MTQYLGRYRVLCPLGQGKMGMVYLARDPVLSRLVAVKVIHADLLLQKEVLQRFFQEAKVAARSQSPHIVNIYDLGHEKQSPFLVMEFIDGQPLQKIMEYLGGDPLPPVVAASLICQAAEGASLAAESGVVHRDLKPANLMVSEKGYVKITDFGICHLSDHTLTRTGQVLGSPRFMSPEQVRGLKPITPQADLFSLGAVLYYCLSGKAPFQAESTVNLYRQITEEAHLPLEEYGLELDPFLVRLVDTLLQKDPAKRGQGPRWLRFQLKRYLYHQKVIDPAEKVAAFVRDISAQGFKTTSDFSASEIRNLEGSFDLGASAAKPRRIWKGVITGLLAMGCLAGGIIFGRHLLDAEAGKANLEAIQISPIRRPSDLEHAKKPVNTSRPNETLVFPSHGRPRNQPGNSVSSTENAFQDPDDSRQLPEGDAVITIYSAPPFASVTIDGYDYGLTPLEGRILRSGKYRVVLKPKVGRKIDTLLELGPGPHIHRFTLLENPESLEP